MKKNIKQQQIQFWLEKCQKNIELFKLDNSNFDITQKLEFTTTQYTLINVINKVLDSRTKFLGVNIDKFNKGTVNE